MILREGGSPPVSAFDYDYGYKVSKNILNYAK
nr:MAG TPA: hypothetical protein [Caudoviricetes sp.]